MLKPLFRTTILASVLFFLLVYMGMKYHWISAFKTQKQQEILSVSKSAGLKPSLSPPSTDILKAQPITDFIADEDNPDANDEVAMSLEEPSEGNTVEKQDDNSFLPEILENTEATSLIDAMTKDQIAMHCQKLYYESLDMLDDPNADLLIGNCVVSNYQEPFQENFKTPQQLQQEQQTKIKALHNCRNETQQFYNGGFSNIEKELLIGICISDAVDF